jgi:hypothetical protein
MNDVNEKTMLSAYFSRYDFVSIEFLPQREGYNLRFFTETVLPSIEKLLSVAPPTMRDKEIHLHVDNAKSHNSEISLSKTDEMECIRVPQPPYSSNLATCDFFLFKYLKEKLERPNFTQDNDVILGV